MPSETASYTQCVEAGRTLMESSTRDQWALGHLSLHPAVAGPKSGNGVNNGSYDKIEKFASEIGIAFETLRRYRMVVEAWLPVGRPTGVTFSVLDELRSLPDRAERVKRNPKMTMRQARNLVRPPTQGAPSTHTTQAVKQATRMVNNLPPAARAQVARTITRESAPEVVDLTDDSDTLRKEAVRLAAQGASYRQIGSALGVDESSVRRDPAVREARIAADPEAHSVTREQRHEFYCRVLSAKEQIDRLDDALRDLRSSAYSLTKRDARRVLRIMESASPYFERIVNG